jgi:hypothetical protein
MSKWNGGVLCLILAVPLVLKAEWIFADDRTRAAKFILILLYAVFAWFIWQLFATGRTEWTLNDEKIVIHWTKKIPFSRDGLLHVMEWSAVEKINRVSTLHFDYIEFVLSNGMKFKYYRDSLVLIDDYEKMVAAVERKIEHMGLPFNYSNKYF